MPVQDVVRLLVLVVVLLALSGAVLRVAGARVGRAPVVAVVRGGLQLAVIGLVLRGVLASAHWAAGAVLAVMLTTAVWTSSGRLAALQGRRAAVRAVLVAAATGAAVVLAAVFAIGVLPFTARYVVALGGIVIGGTMTSSTLAGRQLLAGLRARHDEVEGWLALGATPRRAVLDVARAAVAESLVPALDQTRTTGLVTLPGAFIGALLGGASPLQAARFQLVVLVCLIASGSVVAVLVTTLLGAPQRLPAPAEDDRRR